MTLGSLTGVALRQRKPGPAGARLEQSQARPGEPFLEWDHRHACEDGPGGRDAMETEQTRRRWPGKREVPA